MDFDEFITTLVTVTLTLLFGWYIYKIGDMADKVEEADPRPIPDDEHYYDRKARRNGYLAEGFCWPLYALGLRSLDNGED